MVVIGEKNAQLICIKDKSCYVQDDSDNKLDENSKINTNEELIDKNDNNTTENEKISKKNEKSPFGMLPKKSAINIVQYKLDFHKFTKTNHMYKKTPLIQPWILTSK